MIFCKSDFYATVWEVKHPDNGKYTDLRITTSEKTTDDKYISSTWFPRVIGKAVNTLKDVKKGDRIHVSVSKFTNESYKKEGEEHGKLYFRLLILEAEVVESNRSASTAATTSSGKNEPAPVADDDEDIPW